MEKFEHKKSLGQHFLNSDVVPRWMCEAGAVGAGDVVLEIGPGTGALTFELLARGAMVKAIETDGRAIQSLQETFATEIGEGRLQVEKGDLRERSTVDVAQIFDLRDHEFKLVANIPYYLSGFLFRSFLESSIQPSDMVFLVQKEVAARICRDQKESLLSLSIKAYGNPSYIRTVGKGHFTPQPKIDSAIIAITNISRHNFKNIAEEDFFNLIHEGFKQKRKQLFGNLRAKYDKEHLKSALTSLQIPTTARAEDIPLETWLRLAAHLCSSRK